MATRKTRKTNPAQTVANPPKQTSDDRASSDALGANWESRLAKYGKPGTVKIAKKNPA
jgi:hypothetical protein